MPEETIAEQSITPDVMDRLTDFMLTTLEQAKDAITEGGKIVGKELPLFVEDYLNWAIVENVIEVTVWSVILIISLFFLKRVNGYMKKMMCGDNCIDCPCVILYLVLMGMYCLTFLIPLGNIVSNVKTICKVKYAPRVYIVDKLMELNKR